MFPSDENSKSLKLKTKGKKKEIPSSPLPRSRKVSKNLGDDLEKPTEDVLRIQGGSSCTRDVWDILAQAAEEIEDLYTNQDATPMSTRYSDVQRTPVSGLNQSRESTCIRRLQFSTPISTCDTTCDDQSNAAYNANATYDAAPACPVNQTYNANANYNANATYDVAPPCPVNQTYSVGSPRNRTHNANATYDVCPTNRTYSVDSPRNRTYSTGSPRNQTYSIGSPRNRTYSLNSPRSETYISEGSDYECDYSSGRSMSNGTFVLSECDDSFRPHPALTSSPKMRDGRLPRFRNYTCPSLRSGHEDAYQCSRSDVPDSQTRSINDATYNRTYNVSGGCPYRTYDVSGGSPNRSYDVSGGSPNRSYDVSGGSSNRSYDVSGGCPNRTNDVSGGSTNRTYEIDDSFRPHPALTSSPKTRDGRLPRFRNFTNTCYDEDYQCSRSDVPDSQTRSINDATYNRTHTVSRGCTPNATYDVSRDGHDATYDVTRDCPNSTYDVCRR